jgi:phosphate transport system permease protein
MTSVPTVIYGFVAVCLLVPLVRDAFSTGTGFSLLTAALTVSVLILPTIVLLIDVGLRQIDPHIKLACHTLGLSPVQAQLRVLFPMAKRSLLAAAVLGFCRAVGDTLIALMVAGNAPQVPSSFTESIRTLTAHIALVVATDWYSPEYRSVAAAGLLLFALSAGSSVVIRRLRLVPRRERSDAKRAFQNRGVG